MQAFDYAAAHTVEEAVSLLSRSRDGARVLAGGTDLLVQLREGRTGASLLVDIKSIPEANQLSYSADTGLLLGASVPCFRIYNEPAIAEAYPGLIDAVSMIGGIQIQGRATVGGNLANASPAADSIPPLIVHRALCRIAGPEGYRQIPVEDFCTGPGQTVLRKGEFLVALLLPAPRPGFGAHYLRFIPRNEMDIAVVGAGASVLLDSDGETCREARVALAAVAPRPLLVPGAGDALVGQRITDAVIEKAAQIVQRTVTPISDLRGTAAQRRHLAKVLTRRAIRGAVARAQRTL
jgi:CO/xanthine dehydrogenase FAD-binding subunit